MHKIITILFIFLLLLVAPVYAGSSFQYSKLIKTDNLLGYKSVVLDKDVYAHSNHLNDLRVINDKGEEVPYFFASIRDASTIKEKESFILSEDAQYISTQDGTDSIITIQVNHLDAFRLELNADDIRGRTYGLFGVKDESMYYLSEGELFDLLPSDSSVRRGIEWTNNPNNPPVDKLRLTIHNLDGKPIKPKSVTVKYHLTKLVFKDLGNSQFRLAYGNDALRSPIYEVLNYKAILKSESITQTELGAEVKTPTKTDTPGTSTKYTLFSTNTLTALALLMLLEIGLGFRSRKKKN
jgi:hypothetical protein